MQKQPAKKPGDKVFRVPRVSPVRISVPPVPTPKISRFSPILLVYGFAIFIALGTCCLSCLYRARQGSSLPSRCSLYCYLCGMCYRVGCRGYRHSWSSFGQACDTCSYPAWWFRFHDHCYSIFPDIGTESRPSGRDCLSVNLWG